VGIFSGQDKLGEGFGSSLKMAEYRVSVLQVYLSVIISLWALQAAEDSLHRLYLTRTPDHLLQVPSSTFPSKQGNIYKTGSEAPYTPGVLGEAEIMYASSGRSNIVAPKRLTLEEIEAKREGLDV
jgi:large subunit ribosomal protein L44